MKPDPSAFHAGTVIGHDARVYGVPKDLPVDALVGQTLDQICMSQFQVQLHLGDTVSIGIEGHWVLLDPEGNVVDQCLEPQEREVFRLHLLLGSSVTGCTVDAPESFTLVFEHGYQLTVHDDSSQYESFTLSIRGRPQTIV